MAAGAARRTNGAVWQTGPVAATLACSAVIGSAPIMPLPIRCGDVAPQQERKRQGRQGAHFVFQIAAEGPE